MNELKAQVASLERQVKALQSILGRGDFLTSTVQQKDASFNGRVKLVNRAATPATAAIGEICMAASHFYVCKSANTWTLVT